MSEKKIGKFIIIIISICLFLVTGCNINNPLVLEMEAAYKLPSNSSTESNKHVAQMISMRFPKHMKVSDALKEINENKFKITEGNREGFRQWPDGDFKPHVAEDIKKISKKIILKPKLPIGQNLITGQAR